MATVNIRKTIPDVRINRPGVCPRVDGRLKWKVCEKPGTNRAERRLLLAEKAVSPVALKVTRGAFRCTASQFSFLLEQIPPK